jgi:hypothetical protein
VDLSRVQRRAPLVPAWVVWMSRHSATGEKTCGFGASGRHMHMDAARKGDIPRFLAKRDRAAGSGRAAVTCTWTLLAFRRAAGWLDRQDLEPPRTERFFGNRELRAKLAWVLGQRWRGFVPALCCTPGPLRASMRICRPLALNLQVHATRPAIEALSPVWKELDSHRLRGIELAALPPTSAVGDMPHVLSAGACGARDRRRAYAYGLSERAGYATSLGRKPRQGCPQTHANSAFSPCCRTTALCAAALSVSQSIQRRARRKASSIHARMTAAGPPTSCPFVTTK